MKGKSSVQQTAAAMPMPTPVVNLQPRIPADAIGIPKRKQNAIHRIAAGEKPVPPPSVAGPWETSCPVDGLNTSGSPVTLLIMAPLRGRRWCDGRGVIGDAKTMVND
jgi:hypothetical protein